ncbi:MAG TPA: MipA/OmpV family protein [Burkholderiales bacterium]|jgi:outer membrane scaffolding protein for murein synthesis (MipA/OmpV family)|nr:MipA/OmpV family protein [Burkholderiales bacterium]
MRNLLTFLYVLASPLSSVAFAQDADKGDAYVGLGARVRPAYEGADSRRVEAIPYLRLYGEHLFARTTQGIFEGGVRSNPTGGVVFGAQLAYEEGRVTDESAFLKAHNFEDIDAAASVGVHAEADWKIGPMPLNALARYRRNADSDLGVQADLRLTAGIFSRWGVNAGVFGQITWSDDKATQNYFGLTPQQSSRTGLPVYSAGAGLRSVAFGIVGSADLSKHWLVLWGLNAYRLEGDARNSPIVQEGTNWFVNGGLAYRF